MPLVVDQSWGPHFGFHEDLPPSALALGADAVLTSTHKIVGSLTQRAMLHVAPTGRIDADAVARAVRLVRSTSQSSLLMASLDAARRQLAVHGEALLSRTIAARRAPATRSTRRRPAASSARSSSASPASPPGTRCGSSSTCAGPGCTGYEVADALREPYDVHVELATHATVVLVLGIAERRGRARALRRTTSTRHRAPDRAPGRRRRRSSRRPAALRNEVASPPREAFLGASEIVAVDDAVGPRLGESIAGYPPGIPALLPGERITAETVAYLRELRASGARLHGASDPEFRTIVVLARRQLTDDRAGRAGARRGRRRRRRDDARRPSQAARAAGRRSPRRRPA